jgi:4-amino-4-deoxy-L-arabinose transferase-like glycosyltransferase
MTVAALAIRYWGRWTGLLAGLLVALSGPLLVAEQYVMAETLFIPLATLGVTSLALALERPRWWTLLLGGMLIGVAALTRPVGLVLAVAVLMALPVASWWRRADGGLRLPLLVLQAASLVVGVALIWVPWMARNAAVHGSFSAEGNAGQTLVGRAMRHDRGFAFENPDDLDSARLRAREIMRDGRGGFVSPVRSRIMRDLRLSDAEANRLMRDLALEAILRQPGYYLYGTVRWFGQLAQGSPERYRDHWQTRRDGGNREEWESYTDIRHLLGPPSPLQQQQYDEAEALISLFQSARLGPMVPVLALVGAVGLAAGVGARSRRPGVALFLALVVVGLLLAAVAMVAPLARYRYPIEPLLGLLAAGGVATLAGLVRRRVRTSAADLHPQLAA